MYLYHDVLGILCFEKNLNYMFSLLNCWYFTESHIYSKALYYSLKCMREPLIMGLDSISLFLLNVNSHFIGHVFLYLPFFFGHIGLNAMNNSLSNGTPLCSNIRKKCYSGVNLKQNQIMNILIFKLNFSHIVIC